MREELFIQYLENDTKIISKDKAVKSRLSKARKIENEFNVNLDMVVTEDETMYEILLKIKNEMKDTNGAIQNALRKYYHFINNKHFPNLAVYEKSRKQY